MRLIDIDDVFGEKVIMVSQNAYDEVMKLMRMIREAPEVDAVPVVRCKDCKHYWKNTRESDEVVVCLASSKDDAFCSEGERREDE